MKMMPKGYARGLSRSRTFGDGMMVAGKSMFLPSERIPVVVQSLTSRQISAIPSDTFSVKVLGHASDIRPLDALKMARAISLERKVGVVVSGQSALRGFDEIK